MTKRQTAEPSLSAGPSPQATSSPADKSPSDNGSRTGCSNRLNQFNQHLARTQKLIERRKSFMAAVVQKVKDLLGELGRGGDEERSRFARAARKWPISEDQLFARKSARYPGLLMKLAHSKPGTGWTEMVKEHVLDPESNVQLEAVFDIDYQESQKATVSSWRSQYVRRVDGQEASITFNEVAFRNADGSPGIGDGLRFTLKDLAGEAAGSGFSRETLQHEIRLSCAMLCNCLDQAEGRQSMLRNETATPRALKRRRLESPEETLTQEDKTRMSDERRTRKKAAITRQTKTREKSLVGTGNNGEVKNDS